VTFRLGLLNPNTTLEHTESMAALALSVLPEGTDVVALTAERGPETIESEVDHSVAGAEIAALVRTHPDLDAYLVACFDDPGLEAARELTAAPVVGIGESAYRAASLVAARFAVITTLARGVPALEDAVASHGLASRCVGVLPLAISVAEHERAADAIVSVGRRAVAERGAEALVLACGPMGTTARALQEEVGVPVVEGVAFGALTAWSLWRSGLGTSKAGAYGYPEPIPYAGMPDFGRTGVA